MEQKLPVQKEIFCRYIVRKGKIIYPKNAKFFRFFVNDKTAA
jgi:hypothetical protein